MPLSLEEYATWLDQRDDLYWPAPPKVEPAKAKPHLRRLRDIRIITFNTYGTLLAIRDGELHLVHPNAFVMDTALDKTIQEFKMWQYMSRKPGKPSEYMLQIYRQILDELQMRPAGQERYPEVRVNEVWERIVKRLLKKEYPIDTEFYGSLNRFAECVAYFFHRSLQGVGPEPGALQTLRTLRQWGYTLGIIGDGQVFTRLQLLRALRRQGKLGCLEELFDPELIAISAEVGARRPSETLFRRVLSRVAERGLNPTNVLHVGCDVERDIAPAKRLRMRTALYAGDRAALRASRGQLEDKSMRPDLLLSELPQLALCLKDAAPNRLS